MKPSGQFNVTLEAAHLYERVAARHILGPWAASLVDAAGVAEGERVLDLACGTGVVARIAAQHAGARGRVIGVDLNAGMIAVARSLAVPEGAPLEWLEGSALAIPLADSSVGVVLCQQGFQFFPDKPLAMREMRRVLDRGGRLALSVWSGIGIYNSAVGEALARFSGRGHRRALLRFARCACTAGSRAAGGRGGLRGPERAGQPNEHSFAEAWIGLSSSISPERRSPHRSPQSMTRRAGTSGPAWRKRCGVLPTGTA